MSDELNIRDAYFVIFWDQTGVLHTIPFGKTDDPSANQKAEKLVKTLREIGLEATKLHTFGKPKGSP